jgi:hypothetical protein
MSEDIFDNREDLLRSLTRLLSRQLIESNTKSTETIAGASHVRVTSAGWYYSRYLVMAFSYLDLVLQDTPLNSVALERKLRSYVEQVDNLSDREDQKLERMRVRFSRAREFLDYLQTEENREAAEFDLAKRGGIWAAPFVPRIREQIEREIAWIERRLKENRERLAEDIRFESDPDEPSIIDLGESETGDEEGDEQSQQAAESNGS